MYKANEEDIAYEHRRQITCQGCPFDGPNCGTRGAVDAPIVFVGESPGMQEVRKGIPLVGPSGSIFDMNVPPDQQVYILNAVECMPKTALKDDDHMTVAMNCCHDNLIAKIAAHPRKLIVTMGNWATRSILGDLSLKITQVRGKIYPSKLAEVGVMPIIHMAALMRGTGSYRQWQRDVAYAIDLGNGAPRKKYVESEAVFAEEDATQEQIDTYIEEARQQGNYDELVCDLETSSLKPKDGYILQIGISNGTNPKKSWIFGLGHAAQLKSHLENREIKWAYHNGKFDIKWLERQNINARVDDDTMLMSYTLDEEGGIHGLETVAGDLLEAPNYKDMLKPWLPNKQTSYSAVPYDVLGKYCAIDCGNTAQIRPILRERIRRDPMLEKLYTETLIPAVEYLARVELNGASVDMAVLDENDAFYTAELATHKATICKEVGYDINPGSPKQVKNMLYNELGYRDRYKGSTDVDTINKLMAIKPHIILTTLLAYRKAVKMHGTYIKGWRKHMSRLGSRIHCTYNIHGTRTGRLSSSKPNMQNIPRLARIRNQVVAAMDCELVEIDYSQAELRLLAALSEDPILCAIFINGGDPHTDLANVIYPGYDQRVKLATDTNDSVLAAQCKEERTKCKNVNFGIIYGITKFGLCQQIKGTPAEAQSMLDQWFGRYIVAGAFINSCRNTPLNNQVITTCFGRKKRVGIVSPINIGFLQNEAANFPPQSIASDFTLHAGIRSWKQLEEWSCRIINTVHDSIIFEIPIRNDGGKIRHKAITYVQENMQAVPHDYGIDQVPFITDVDIGHNWGSLKPYTGVKHENSS